MRTETTTRRALTSARSATSRTRGDRGAALIEFAMAFPILILLMMGVIDFGVNYGNKVQTTHAAREGARAGSVGRVGTDGSCWIDGAPTGFKSRELVCLTKARTHMDPENVRVRISYMDGSGAYTNDFSEATRQQNKYSIMVCVSTRAYSLSGLLGPIFNGKYHHSRAVIKTGTTPFPQASTANPAVTIYQYVGQFSETPFSSSSGNDDWSWCRSDNPVNDASFAP